MKIGIYGSIDVGPVHDRTIDYIAVDRGVEHLYHQGITPIIAIGDMDSLDNEQLLDQLKIQRYSSIKDDTDTALALAVPICILGTIVWAGRMTFDCFFVHMADKYIEEEKYNKIWIANVLLPQILCFCMTAIPCALAAYFGSSYIQGILAMLSGKVLTVFQIIGGLMPALGIAITLQYIFKGESKVFLFIGFLLAVYSKLPLLTLGIIALLVAVVYVQVTSAVQPATAGADYDDEDDEEDD